MKNLIFKKLLAIGISASIVMLSCTATLADETEDTEVYTEETAPTEDTIDVEPSETTVADESEAVVETVDVDDINYEFEEDEYVERQNSNDVSTSVIDITVDSNFVRSVFVRNENFYYYSGSSSTDYGQPYSPDEVREAISINPEARLTLYSYSNGHSTYESSGVRFFQVYFDFVDFYPSMMDSVISVNGQEFTLTDYYDGHEGGSYYYAYTSDSVRGCTAVFAYNTFILQFYTDYIGTSMYRLYNTNSGEHFYTSSAGERDMLVSVGWTYEGIGWIAPSTSDTPVYRLYNEIGGEHHYTSSEAERDFLLSVGWNDEGIGWYSDDAHTVPLYRQYNPNAFANNHNYTTSQSENDYLVSLGWQAEGVGWYGVG